MFNEHYLKTKIRTYIHTYIAVFLFSIPKRIRDFRQLYYIFVNVASYQYFFNTETLSSKIEIGRAGGRTLNC